MYMARPNHDYGEYPLGLRKVDFPLRRVMLRRYYIAKLGRCPNCGGVLDVGRECDDCGYDACAELNSKVEDTDAEGWRTLG